MKVFLMKDEVHTLHTDFERVLKSVRKTDSGVFEANPFIVKLEPAFDTPQQRELCAKLEKTLMESRQQGENDAGHGQGDDSKGAKKKVNGNGTEKNETKWNLKLTMELKEVHIGIWFGTPTPHIEIEVKIEGEILKVLHDLVFPNQVSVKLTIKPMVRYCDPRMKREDSFTPIFHKNTTLSTGEMKINVMNESNRVAIGYCLDKFPPILMDIGQQIVSPDAEEQLYQCYAVAPREPLNDTICCQLTIEVTFYNFLEPCPSAVLNCQKVLDEASGSDLVVIVTGDNKGVSFMSSQYSSSPALKAMLESDMIEARSGRIEMPDISEEGAKAFLAYIYYRGLDKPKEDPAVAFELLNAAEKYDLGTLKADITTIFLEMKGDWGKSNLEVALQLYMYAGKMMAGDLMNKAFKALKGNYADFKDSEYYLDLFQEDPEAAMNLMDDFNST